MPRIGLGKTERMERTEPNLLLTLDNEGEVHALKREKIQFPLPAGPIPPRHGVAMGAVVIGVAELMRTDDAHDPRHRWRRGRYGELISAIPRDLIMPKFFEVTVQRRGHGHPVVAAQDNLPIEAFDLEDIVPVHRGNGLKCQLFSQHWHDAPGQRAGFSGRRGTRQSGDCWVSQILLMVGTDRRAVRCARRAQRSRPTTEDGQSPPPYFATTMTTASGRSAACTRISSVPPAEMRYSPSNACGTVTRPFSSVSKVPLVRHAWLINRSNRE